METRHRRSHQPWLTPDYLDSHVGRVGAPEQVKVLVCISSIEQAEHLTTRLADSPDVELVGSPVTMGRALGILRHNPVDVLLVDAPHMEQSLAVRRADSLVTHPGYRLVLVDSTPSVTRLVRASQYGFDEVIDPETSREEMIRQLQEVVAETRSVHIHPLLAGLEVVPGLFTRNLQYGDTTDHGIVELLSLGLDDGDISTVLGLTIQHVRNNISRLLRMHGLSTRTQLATLYIRGEQRLPMN